VNLGDPIPYISKSPLELTTALFILIFGWFAVKVIVASFRRAMAKVEFPELIEEFLARFLSILLYVSVGLLALNALGISTGALAISFSAIVGLILGFGMQDTLTNIGAGVWLAALRPFDKGEVVTLNGMTGKVVAIGVMATELITPENTVITIPNRLVWGSPITNYTKMPSRRAVIPVRISYKSSLDRAIEIAMKLMEEHPLVLQEPKPGVVISELSESSINLQLMAWAKTENFGKVKGDLIKGILEAYTSEGIEIPYPQMDVHLKKD